MSIGPTHIAIASAARRGEGIEVKRFAVERVEEKICRPSPVEKNITDLPRWQSHVRSALKKFPGRTPVKLSLPDSAARTVLLDLQQLPGERKEFERLIQWHMEKTFLSSLGESRFSYQVLLRRTNWKVLATAVKKEVIEQYEGLDGSRSVEIQAIGLSSLHAFNLYRSWITGLVGESGHFIFAHLLDQSLTVLIFESGLLSFIRVKELTEPSGRARAEGEGGDGPIDLLFGEIGTSLSFYDVGQKQASALTHLFLSLDTAVPDLESRVDETFHLTPVLLDPYRIVRFASGETGLSEPANRTVISAAAAAIGE
ncbi:MAG TPA: hypothetical protein VFA47_13425, partial [Candidatus Manganitrophaceae bacterium]|nr:hypothetical protein [Candidatus Manganitrophaceae bacterium]